MTATLTRPSCPDCGGPLTVTEDNLSCASCGFTETDPSMGAVKPRGQWIVPALVGLGLLLWLAAYLVA